MNDEALHYNVTRGVASQVRQTRSTVLVNNWDRDTIYECLFRLSGQPVYLSLRQAIYIEDGEQIIVVGSHTRSGVFDAKAYRNITAGVIGVASSSSAEILAMILIGGGLALASVFFILPLLDISFSENASFLNILGIVSIVAALAGTLMFRHLRNKRRKIIEILDNECMRV